jgi:hypothetical protein
MEWTSKGTICTQVKAVISAEETPVASSAGVRAAGMRSRLAGVLAAIREDGFRSNSQGAR